MDIENLRQTLLDENKVKPLIEEGFNAIDKDKKGYISFEELNIGVLGKMKQLSLDTSLLPPEVMNRVKSVADPNNEGKVTLENRIKAILALIKIAKDSGNL